MAGGPLPCRLPDLLPPDLHHVPPNLQQPSQHMQGTTPRMSTKLSPLASPSEPTSRKRPRRHLPTTTHGSGQQFLSIPKAGAPSGTQEQTKTANARPNDGSASNGLKGSEGSPWQKPRAPSKRKPNPELSLPDSTDDDDDFQKRDARTTALTRRGHLPVAKPCSMNIQPLLVSSGTRNAGPPPSPWRGRPGQDEAPRCVHGLPGDAPHQKRARPGVQRRTCTGSNGLVSILSQDHIQGPIVSWITSASLAALEKSDGKHRWVAVGQSLRR